MTRLLLACALLLSLAGCQGHHYIVVQDQAPFYATATGDQLLGQLPRLVHGPLELEGELELSGPRLPVSYRGRRGFAPRQALRVFSHLASIWDGGQEREETVQRELRSVQLAELGQDWPKEVVRAVREGRVLKGMSRRQVELAWGWPETVEVAERGDERWVYREEHIEVVRSYVDDPWVRTSWGIFPSTYASSRGWGCRRDRGWVYYHIAVVEERTVTIGRQGVVSSVEVRRFQA